MMNDLIDNKLLKENFRNKRYSEEEYPPTRELNTLLDIYSSYK